MGEGGETGKEREGESEREALAAQTVVVGEEGNVQSARGGGRTFDVKVVAAGKVAVEGARSVELYLGPQPSLLLLYYSQAWS